MKENKNFFWLNSKLKVKDSPMGGKGTFAVKSIKKGEKLLIMGGFITFIKDELDLPSEFNDNGLQITEDLVISVRDKKNLGGINFVNHSCNPNAGINGQIFLVAMKNITAGEEITFDYAMTLYSSKNVPKYKMKCDCKAKNCRGVITSDDWKITELQKKYDGYFQYYLQEKINKTF
jgi:SET domain-containing protein